MRASPPTFLFSKGTNRLLCPVGHLLYKRRFSFGSSAEELASRRLD
jgi:hypothetical protein